MAEPRENQSPMARGLQPWMMVALAAVAHVLFSASVNPFGPIDEDWKELLAIGAWYAQPVLFGLWLALGAGGFSVRFQTTILAFALVLFAGVMSTPYQRRNDSEDVLVRVAMLLVTAVVMHFARRWMGWRISCQRCHEMHPTGPVRFNIKSLLVWTAFLAVLLAIGRILWPFISAMRMGSWDEVALGACVFGLVFGPFAFVSLSILSTRLFCGLSLATLVGGLISELSAPLLLAIVEPMASDQFETILLVAAGGALACVMTVLPLRFVGYRLMNAAA